jgi:2-oxoglutarate dehydrogenase E1 component
MGQDSRRGTFSHRHAAFVDSETGQQWVPLSHLDGAAGFFTVRDSSLSEYAALGYEYGYSVESPESLVAWEAQFGDFVNGAEIIIDNFLVAAEDKWGQTCNLVMLLPHGYEGRIERFLSLCARNNIRVAYPTSSAQYFHLLRSQVRRERKIPLIVFTPKSMLRATPTKSPLSELVNGSFHEVLDDATADPTSVQRVVFATGKIAHEAVARRAELETAAASAVAVVRVEQLYPWPSEAIAQVLDRYADATEVVWLQEEPENMGAWPFVHHQLHRDLRESHSLRHVARAESASPATGSSLVHNAEQADLLTRAIG